MHRLPDEVLILVLSYLSPADISGVQLVSKRLLALGRDSGLWKTACFDHSRFEAKRRRQGLLRAQDVTLAALNRAVESLPNNNPFAASVRPSATTEHGQSQRIPSIRGHASRESTGSRAFANWDPSRPGESIDFYQEYIHRYGPICLDWLQAARDPASPNPHEAMGMSVIEDSRGAARHVVSPLDDGSIALWQLSEEADIGMQGRIVQRTPAGVLTTPQSSQSSAPPTITNETGAIESVSVDSAQSKAYFAVQNAVCEVDLNTLQVIQRQEYPFPVMTLSAACSPTAMTVGTAMTLHIYDARNHRPSSGATSLSSPFARTEQISGPAPLSPSHISLSQPGPLSILHQLNNVWVAGRFTSLLCYDRRYWSQLSGSLFSGARLSSLISLPFAHLDHEFDLHRTPRLTIGAFNAAKNAPGTTLVAAGEYRGKGSVELYGLPNSERPHGVTTAYRNRQTASKSRLLSVAAHGARLVFSDGDGGIKWVERDGCSHVRTFNINDAPAAAPGTAAPADAASVDSGYASATEASGPAALFREGENSTGDIVQKIVAVPGDARRGANGDELLVWTGDGRVGLLGFRRRSAFGDVDADAAHEAAGEHAERERVYEMRMRRALERQADETRFVRGLGLAWDVPQGARHGAR